MKTVKVPAFFQELFGKCMTLVELWLTILFCTGMTIVLLTLTRSEWQNFSFWQVGILCVFLLDISGGVLANFSYSTNLHYKVKPGGRLIFITIHMQPIIFAWLFGGFYGVGLLVWGYTVVSALIVNALIQYPAQRLIGVFLAVSGVSLLLLLRYSEIVIGCFFNVHV